MLLQNPQLAYALLQAQVVMRIIDPTVAMTMLHRDVPVTMVNARAATFVLFKLVCLRTWYRFRRA
jgi:hypothetical protein